MIFSEQAPHLTLTERLAWVYVVIVVAFVFLVGGTYPTMGSALVRAITQALLMGLIVGWALAWFRNQQWAPTRASIAFTGLGLTAGLLSLVGSSAPRLTLEAIYWASLLGGSFLALVALGRSPTFRVSLRSLTILLFLVVLTGYLVQLGLSWSEWVRLTGRLSPLPLHPDGASLTFGASPVVAAVLLILAPVIVTLLPIARHRVLVVGAIIGLTAIAILATGSRSGYLAMGVESLVAVLILGRHRARELVRTARRSLLTTAVVIAGAAGVSLGGSLATRLFDGSTLTERVSIWRSALSIWERSPWFGAGAGTWPYLRAAAYPVGEPSLVVPHAHNPIIQLLAETGIVGVALTVFGVVLLIRAVHAAGASDDPALQRTARATLIGLAGFGAFSVLDDLVNLAAVLLAVAMPLVLVLGAAGGSTFAPRGASESGRPTSRRRVAARIAPAMVAVVTLLVGGLAAVPLNAAAFAAARGIDAADRGDWSTAAHQFSTARDVDPGMPLYHLELATALAAQGNEARAWAEIRDLGQADGTPLTLIARAWLALGQGDLQASRSAIALAFERSTGDATAMLNVGAIAERLGDSELAARAYARAIVSALSLAGSGYLHASPRFKEALASALELAHGSPDGSIAADLISAYAGQATFATADLMSQPSSAARDRALAVSLTLLGKIDDATQLLRNRLDSDPLDGQTAELLARIRLDVGDTVGAMRYGRWARIAGVGSAALPVASGSAVVTVREAGTANVAQNYPWAIYWRFGPKIMLPPEALTIADQ